MNRKIQPEYVHDEYGFPIRIVNAPMMRVRDVWVHAINQRELQKIVAEALPWIPSRFTGHMVHFCRHALGMTLTELGERLGVSHSGVIKWEKARGAVTTMSWALEKDLRIEMLMHFGASPEQIVSLYRHLAKVVSPDTNLEPIVVETKAA